MQEITVKIIDRLLKAGLDYSMPYIGNSINSLVEYIQNNTREEDKVLVYPEGLSINVMCNRDSDNKFYSLIPLYIETFGEDNSNNDLYENDGDFESWGEFLLSVPTAWQNIKLPSGKVFSIID